MSLKERYKSQIEILNQKESDFQNTCSEISKHLSQVQEYLHSKTDLLSQISTSRIFGSEMLSNLMDEFENKKKEHLNETSNISQNSLIFQNLKKEIQQLKDSISKLHTHVDDIQNEITKIKSKISNHKETISSLTSSISLINEQLNKINEPILDLNTKIKEKSLAICEIEKVFGQTQETIKNFSNEKNQIQEILKQKSTAQRQISSSLMKLQLELTPFSNSLMEYRQQLTSAKANLDRVCHRSKQKLTALQDIKNQTQLIMNSIQQTEQSINNSNAEHQNILFTLKALRMRSTRISTEEVQLHSEIVAAETLLSKEKEATINIQKQHEQMEESDKQFIQEAKDRVENAKKKAKEIVKKSTSKKQTSLNDKYESSQFEKKENKVSSCLSKGVSSMNIQHNRKRILDI